MLSLDPLLALLEKTYGVRVPTATTVRKAVSTVGAREPNNPQVRLLSKQLSHRVDTHHRHYEQLDTVAGAAQAHRIVQGLSTKSKPRAWTTHVSPRSVIHNYTILSEGR